MRRLVANQRLRICKILRSFLKYRGSAFKISTLGGYIVVISGSDILEDIRQATDEQLSAADALNEVFKAFIRLV